MIFRLIAMVGIMFFVIAVLLAFAQAWSIRRSLLEISSVLAVGFLIVLLGALLLLNFQIFRLGTGLRTGERQAVYGLCVAFGLTLLCCLASFASEDLSQMVALLPVPAFPFGQASFVANQPTRGVFSLFLVGIMYIPPIVSAFNHWKAFK
jgi:hypothetical protein